MRSVRFTLFASAAFVFSAGCSDHITAPADPASPSASGAQLLAGATTDSTIVPKDSVISGYGCPATGGLEYGCTP